MQPESWLLRKCARWISTSGRCAFLLDESAPGRLMGELAKLGHDVTSITSLGLGTIPDEEVFAVGQRIQAVIIARDMHFSNAERTRSVHIRVWSLFDFRARSEGAT